MHHSFGEYCRVKSGPALTTRHRGETPVPPVLRSHARVYRELHGATPITNERRLRRSQLHTVQRTTAEPCLKLFWLHRVQPSTRGTE